MSWFHGIKCDEKPVFFRVQRLKNMVHVAIDKFIYIFISEAFLRFFYRSVIVPLTNQLMNIKSLNFIEIADCICSYIAPFYKKIPVRITLHKVIEKTKK